MKSREKMTFMTVCKISELKANIFFYIYKMCETKSAKSLTLSVDSNKCRLLFTDHFRKLLTCPLTKRTIPVFL